MDISKPEDFYAAWSEDRTYVRADLKPKHRRQYEAQFWRPARCRADMSVLEVGCGTGLFLAFLAEKGVTDFTGVDPEPRVLDHMPAALAEHVHITDILGYLDGAADRTFDRVAMFDVFEHFSPYEGVDLLRRLRSRLAPDGLIAARVPNLSSPWGLRHHFGDLTHKAAYTPDSIKQAAAAAGYRVVECVPVRRARGARRLVQTWAERLAGWAFGEAPEVWTATFVAILQRD